MMPKIHVPVLQKEVIKYLDPKPNENFIDCTIGCGGHAMAILERNTPQGKVLGIEWDSDLYSKLLKANIKRLILANDSFSHLKEIVKKYNLNPVQGILFDLGMSSWHLEKSQRGFSFSRKEPLDMRYNLKTLLRAEDIVNKWQEEEIERILKEYGQERFAKNIARNIIEFRKGKLIKTTTQLVEIIKKSTPSRYQHKKIHIATKTFQALRIAVNNELENLKIALPQALDILSEGGKLVVISFHSLEDRIVKKFLRENLKVLTKKPVMPTLKEKKINPRSRSAKLRAGQKSKTSPFRNFV